MKGNVLIKVIFSVALMVMGMMAGATPVGQRDTMARKTDGREVVLLKKGDMMPNYVFKDVNGKRVSLKSSCVEQSPYLLVLEDKLHNKKIVFVSISVDKHREAWVRKVKAEKSRVPQWICPEGEDTPLLADFGVVAIPRFILLDKKGRIVDGDFGMPAWARTEMDLRWLEGI